MQLDQFKLTTIDNHINPFLDWKAWFLMDINLGHDTCGLLDRVCGDTNIDDGSIQQAMKDIARLNLSGVHIIVSEKNFDEDLRLARLELAPQS